jgi:molybdenum cofactor biosynthesis enzyme MoaA
MPRRHPLRNSGAELIEAGGALVVESPDGERFPVEMGVLSLTSRCNLGCLMCIEPRGGGPTDLPFDAAMELVDVFAGRVPKIWSCAGEALLHPRFFEIASAIAARGTRLGIGSNGLVLSDPTMLQRCADAGVRWLHISCHTCRPERFAALTATSGSRRFDEFVQGLRNVDDWNRDHEPGQRFEVLLQLVLMRSFAEELDDYLEFVGRVLSHSPVVVRVEPMQLLNAAREHPELQLDLAEVGRIVRRLIEQHSRRLTFEFKGIPLCVLEGAEGLSEDLRKRAAGEVVVGNLGHDSGGLQLQCPIGDPALSACAACCAGCSLVDLCPGVMDIPVPDGCAWPRVRSTDPTVLLAGLGLRTDFAHRRFPLVYPIHSSGPDPEAPTPPPEAQPGPAPERGPAQAEPGAADTGPPAAGAAAAAAEVAAAAEPGLPRDPADAEPEGRSLEPARLDLDLESDEEFTPAQARMVQWIVRALRRDDLVTDARVSERFVAVALSVADRAPEPVIVVFEPARAAKRSVFVVGGVAVRYNGELTSGLRTALERIRRLLAAGRRPA